MDKHKNIVLFTLSFVITLIVMRFVLAFFREVHDVNNFGPYNIHHALIGAFLLIGVIILWLCTAITHLTVLLAGIGSALVVDEMVYFIILTQGNYELYLGKASFWGAVIIGGIVLLTTAIIYYTTKKR